MWPQGIQCRPQSLYDVTIYGRGADPHNVCCADWLGSIELNHSGQNYCSNALIREQACTSTHTYRHTHVHTHTHIQTGAGNKAMTNYGSRLSTTKLLHNVHTLYITYMYVYCWATPATAIAALVRKYVHRLRSLETLLLYNFIKLLLR